MKRELGLFSLGQRWGSGGAWCYLEGTARLFTVMHCRPKLKEVQTGYMENVTCIRTVRQGITCLESLCSIYPRSFSSPDWVSSLVWPQLWAAVSRRLDWRPPEVFLNLNYAAIHFVVSTSWNSRISCLQKNQDVWKNQHTVKNWWKEKQQTFLNF